MQNLFAELRRPPEAPPKPLPMLAPPWQGIAAGAPDSPAAWKPTRARLEERWRGLIGPLPPAAALRPELIGREELPDHTRIRLRYRADEAGAPDSTPDAYLLLPKGVSGHRPSMGVSGRRPGMVVLHQTTNEHIAQAVGISGREAMHLALHLVRRGYVCLAPRNFLWSREGVP
ncbi:MAG: hypothetical protein FJX77_15065, partial [Armatimonadetes bacterium]|nr:hypothetical protein [Armatimonadota bacterium]